MASIFNIARMTVTGTPGTGTITLGSAVSSFLSFADAGVTNAKQVTYVIEDGVNREMGRGTYTSAGTTLSRDTVLKSTNAGAKISATSAAEVYIAFAAEDVLSFSETQTFTQTEKETARGNLYAAPFDALAYNGVQTNGTMLLNQFNNGVTTTLASGVYSRILDGWEAVFNRTATLAMTAAQVSSPGSGVTAHGCLWSLQMTATTGLASLAATDYAYMEHRIEGYRSAQRVLWGSVLAMPITIGFWVYTTIAGTMAVMLTNSAYDRKYIRNVTVNNALTWEFKTVTIPGDTSGSWDWVNGTGMRVIFCFGCGTTYQATADTWGTTGIGTSSTTNFFASTNNIAAITGVVVLPGLELPTSSLVPRLYRPFAEELDLAQRYFWTTYNYGDNPGKVEGTPGTTSLFFGVVSSATTQQAIPFLYAKPMRAVPTVHTYDGQGNIDKCDALTPAWTSNNAVTIGAQQKHFWVQEGPTSTTGYKFHATADSRLA